MDYAETALRMTELYTQMKITREWIGCLQLACIFVPMFCFLGYLVKKVNE
jgi:hypothetical protein